MRSKFEARQRRRAHSKARVRGTAERPRLAVYRSSKHIYAQIINDETMSTISSANDLKIAKGTPIEKASEVGKLIAEAAKKTKVTKVVFDRAGYKFHGRVKSLAEAARSAGLEF